MSLTWGIFLFEEDIRHVVAMSIFRVLVQFTLRNHLKSLSFATFRSHITILTKFLKIKK